MRSVRAAGLVIAAGLVVALSATSSLAAGEGQCNGQTSGTSTRSMTFGSGTFGWDKTGKTLSVTTKTLGTLSANYCVDSWFDWRVSGGHHDSRAVRVCQQSKTKASGLLVDNTPGRTQLSMRVIAVCQGPWSNKDAIKSNCNMHPNACVADNLAANAVFPNYSTRSWQLSPTGTSVAYNSGGSAASSTD